MALSASWARDPVLSVPFRFTNGWIWVETCAGPAGSRLSLLLDSGAAVSTLNASTAKRLGLREGAPVHVKHVEGSTIGRWPQPLSVKAGNVPLPSRYLVADLSHLEKTCGHRIDGLIGADFFASRIVELDFAAQRLTLRKRAVAGANAEAIPLQRARGVWIAKVRVAGHTKQRLRVDTGCASALHWVQNASLKSSTPATHTLAAVHGEPLHTSCTVELGARSFTVAARIHAQPLFAGEDGLLGNGIFGQFTKVVLDGRNDRLLLVP